MAEEMIGSGPVLTGLGICSGYVESLIAFVGVAVLMLTADQVMSVGSVHALIAQETAPA
jgi:hypothetical protein